VIPLASLSPLGWIDFVFSVGVRQKWLIRKIFVAIGCFGSGLKIQPAIEVVWMMWMMKCIFS
jgi:hypothetical protein